MTIYNSHTIVYLCLCLTLGRDLGRDLGNNLGLYDCRLYPTEVEPEVFAEVSADIREYNNNNNNVV